MRVKLSAQEDAIFRDILTEICRNSRMLESGHYIQHGTTSVFRHSVAVAYVSFWIACRMRITVEQKTLIRGALLHDYFLYDWHEKDDSHKWHGFFHAKKAWENALRDIPDLNAREQDMIRRHMFPLNPIPPRYRESWILCLADKICSSGETVDGIIKHLSGGK